MLLQARQFETSKFFSQLQGGEGDFHDLWVTVPSREIRREDN
jgi:hypothetical protein